MPDSSTDEDDLSDASGATPPAGGIGAAAPLPDGAAGAAPTRARSEGGQYLSANQGRRKRQTPTFRVIELSEVEAPTCAAAAATTEPLGCVAPYRCAAHGGTTCRRWLIRGPVLGFSDDAERFSSVVVVGALAWMPPLEVYVRALPHLSPAAYLSCSGARPSVSYVASACAGQPGAWSTGEGWSSFRGFVEGQALTSANINKIGKRAVAAVKASGGVIANGNVPLVEHRSVRDDSVYVAAHKAIARRLSATGARLYKKRGEAAARARWPALLHGGHSAGSVARTRSWVEHGACDGGSRAGRLRLSHGLSQMHLFPTRSQLREERRQAFERDGIDHFFFTRSALGGLMRWDYIDGSGASGIRRYRNQWGLEKRLRSHTNTYWEERTPSSGDGGGRGELLEEDVSEDEDGGIHFFNADAETEGCYAAVPDDPAALAALQVQAESYLEDTDTSDPVKILAVGFDAQAALQRAVDSAAVAGATASRVAGAPPAVITFAADGGTIKRRQLTALTVSLSSPLLAHGRTDLTPIVYVLSGEKEVDRGIWAHVRDTLKRLNSDGFTIPVTAASEGSQSGQVARIGDARQPLRLYQTIHVCGTCDEGMRRLVAA